MTFQQQIIWENLDHLHRSSVAYQFASYALKVSYDLLPEDVVQQAKRCILDAVGSAMRGRDAPGCDMVVQVVRDLGGAAESTVIGSPLRTSASNAALVNSFAASARGYHDPAGGYAADPVAALLAVAEREGASGRALLTAVVAAYELSARYLASVNDWRGWAKETSAALVLPAVLGSLMRLDADRIVNAIGTCASGNAAIGGGANPLDEGGMNAGMRYAWSAHAAVVTCQLARHGFTGPPRVVEGDGALRQVMFGGHMDLEKLTDFRGWRIRAARFADSPVSDSALEGKLRQAAGSRAPAVEELIATIGSLEKIDDVSMLGRMLMFQS